MSHDRTEVLKTNLKTFNKTIPRSVSAIKEFYYRTVCQYGPKIKVKPDSYVYFIFIKFHRQYLIKVSEKKSIYLLGSINNALQALRVKRRGRYKYETYEIYWHGPARLAPVISRKVSHETTNKCPLLPGKPMQIMFGHNLGRWNELILEFCMKCNSLITEKSLSFVYLFGKKSNNKTKKLAFHKCLNIICYLW